jgi:tRNA U34 2-thiouridine synthase MnmA/TrmU
MKIKALAMLSGGLDSRLAAKLILDQGIDVVAINFTSPFCMCNQKGRCVSSDAARQLGIPLKTVSKGEEYIKVIRKPKYGYGAGVNPCLDCRIFTLKKAKRYAKKIGAKFIFTGEVYDQRPMSQRAKAMRIIEKEAGLEGKLLRPLSAKLLPETEAEKKGWVDRKKLLGLKGRTRRPQIRLARKFGLVDYPCPAGGCLLTYKEFANKAKDLFSHKKTISLRDMKILKYGRHFRFGKNKIIVGRNEGENKTLLSLKNPSDYLFEVPDCGSPITLLQGEKTGKAIELAASLTARYSDKKGKLITVKYGKTKPARRIEVPPPNKKKIDRLRVC